MTETLQDIATTTGERTSTVLLRYFAGARAAAGVAEEHVELATGGTVADALTAALDRHGEALARILPACSFLLDGVAVHEHTTAIRQGGQLDVLPPFAGG